GAEVTKTVSLAAGDEIAVEMLLGTGLAKVTALYAEGGPEVEGVKIRFDLLDVTAGIDGKRKTYGGRHGPGDISAPAGDYVLAAKLDSAEVMSAPFTIEPGEATDVQIILNAGVAAITAAGARRIDVITAEADINGKKKSLGGGYGETLQMTLPAGKYGLKIDYEGDKPDAETTFEVTAGSRAEVAVP
ncbi:MAG: VWA domain-containing protein, partial [Deltaproteobacteria bacterium]